MGKSDAFSSSSLIFRGFVSPPAHGGLHTRVEHKESRAVSPGVFVLLSITVLGKV